MNKVIWLDKERKCGECTKCCEGWLAGDVYDHEFYPGKPCFFLKERCSIYEQRPENPCQKFECTWLKDYSFPSWLKPSKSNVIVVNQKIEINEKITNFYHVVKAGNKIDSSVLDWLFQYKIDNNINLVFPIEGAYT